MGKKSLLVGQYILEKCRETESPVVVSSMKLLKLVYIAHGYNLARYGNPLIDEPVMAWENGPFVPSLYQAIRVFKSNAVQDFINMDFSVFNENEKLVMNDIVSIYHKSPAMELSLAMQDEGSPWSIIYNASKDNAEIPDCLIKYFYSYILNQKTHSIL